MRTTITLDEDVSSMIQRLREKEKKPFKTLVNELLRAALIGKKTAAVKKTVYATPELAGGNSVFADLDNVAEVLAVAEKEDFS